MILNKEIYARLNNYALVDQDINKYLNKLIKYASKNGFYKNFGQREYNKLNLLYSNISLKDDDIESSIESFKDYMQTYSGESEWT